MNQQFKFLVRDSFAIVFQGSLLLIISMCVSSPDEAVQVELKWTRRSFHMLPAESAGSAAAHLQTSCSLIPLV